MKIDFVRELALKAIYKIEEEKAYSNIVIDSILKENREKITKTDVGFFSELVYGVTTWKITIDFVIQKYATIKLKKMSPWVLGILRLGVYQILFLDRIPESAAVNESVNLTKKYAPRSSGFVNAILRKVKKEDRDSYQTILDVVQRKSVQYSMPIWLIEILKKQYTEEQVEKICEQSNERSKMTIRVNTLKTTKEELIANLREKEIKVEEAELTDFLYLENVKNIIQLSEYQKGYFTVQDESAGLPALVLNPQEGERILDVCSAPGGKTTYLAQIMNNTGKIMACDLYEARLHLVEENAKRLGIKTIETTALDGTTYQQEWQEKWDRILLDVPCMGLGVIRKKPDIKWQRKQEDLIEIGKIQKSILENASRYLKKGGYLVYSTCSILREENEEVVQAFLEKNKQFELEKIEKEHLAESDTVSHKKGMIHILPNTKKDGFFVAFLHKK